MTNKERLVPKRRFLEFQNADPWEQRKLSSLCSMHARIGWQNLRTSEFLDSGDYYLITGTDFEDGRINFNTCHYIDKARYDQDRKIQLTNGSILITKDGTLGKVAYIDGLDKPATLNAGVFNVTTSSNEVDVKYLFQYLKAPFLMDYVSRKATGGTIKHLNQNILIDFPVILPKVEEQRKIGVYLEKLDNLITLHQRKLIKLKEIKKAYLTEMFPKEDENKPKRRFSGFTDPWEQRKFGDLADYKKGPFGSAITKDMFVPKSDDSIKVYEQQNAINKDWSLARYFLPKEYALKKLKSFEVHGGDIIVSCAGTIGEIYEIPENADSGVINQALMRVRIDGRIVDKKMFVIAFSNMIEAFSRTRSNGSAIKNIPPFADLKPMEVLIPSMEEQQKISGYFDLLDNLITLHQRKLNKLQELKEAYLNEMFV